MNCLKCGDTGRKVDGTKCDCGIKKEIFQPLALSIPKQYQSVEFNRSFLNSSLNADYGVFMEKLLNDIEKMNLDKNIMICSPPNSGKTIFAYNAICLLYSVGVKIPVLKDLLEVREILHKYYDADEELRDLYSNAPLAIIKVPLDLPNKSSEIMSTIIERRVRNSGNTIFLYSGSESDLLAQDRFGRLKMIIGDGSYNSIQVRSWS